MAKMPAVKLNGQRGTSLKTERFLGTDPMPKELDVDRKKHDGPKIVVRRHTEWLENQILWRQLLDAYEGGMRYRNAVYGPDRRGLPTRNLFRHRREYPDPGQFPSIYQGFAGFMGMASARTQDVGFGPYPGMIGADPAATANDDDYELRRSRTPVPEFVAEAVWIHLGKIYDQSVSRQGPDWLKEWWKDVDDRGTSMDEYMKQNLAPLVAVLGCIDICVDHPYVPNTTKIVSKADEILYGVDRICMSLILPQNMVWWRLDVAGRYVECLVREYTNPSDRVDHDPDGNPIDPDDPGSLGEQWRRDYVQYRHWTAEKSTLYNHDGEEQLEEIEHQYGRVPIVRLIPFPKHRTSHVGKSYYEFIAEVQREYYNRDSELILSDTQQAHPLLSGPEDYCKADQTVSIGPGFVLPMKECQGHYQGWEFVAPSKDPAKSLRENKKDLMDLKDRHACLTKPAGFAGAASTTASQSGIAKQLDAVNGNKLLSDMAKGFAKAESFVSEYVFLCKNKRPPTREEREQIVISYPARFELFGAMELADMLARFQLNLSGLKETGCPISQAIWLKEIVNQGLIGLTQDQYDNIYAEVDEYVEDVMQKRIALGEAAVAGIHPEAAALQGQGTELSRASEDPTGLSGSTRVSPVTPAVV